jgi:hypothetical protein
MDNQCLRGIFRLIFSVSFLSIDAVAVVRLCLSLGKMATAVWSELTIQSRQKGEIWVTEAA